MHDADEVDPARTEYLPAGHQSHADAPSLSENDPAVHCTHVLEELAPVSVENVPTKHDLQKLLEFAAKALEYLPAPQIAQLDVD